MSIAGDQPCCSDFGHLLGFARPLRAGFRRRLLGLSNFSIARAETTPKSLHPALRTRVPHSGQTPERLPVSEYPQVRQTPIGLGRVKRFRTAVRMIERPTPPAKRTPTIASNAVAIESSGSAIA
jgi:hypothetical protein